MTRSVIGLYNEAAWRTGKHVALAVTNVANTINNLWIVRDHQNRLARRAP